MKYLISLVIVVALMTPPLFAQTRVASGTLSAASASCLTTNCVQLALPFTIGTVGVQISGTFSATLQFEGTVTAGGTYVAVAAVPVAGGAVVTSTTTGGVWQVPASGLVSVQVRVSAFTSGAPVVRLVSSDASSTGATSASEISDDGELLTVVCDGAGNDRCANVDANNNLTVITPSVVYNATPPTLTNGQTTDIQISTRGELKTNVCDAAANARCANVDASNRLTTAPTLVSGSVASGAIASGAVASGAFASGALASGSVASGAFAAGSLSSALPDPCTTVAKSTHVVNMATATTVEIANAVASQFFYICSVNLVAAAAQTIAIGEDDTDGCGSITAGLHGGATAATGWSFGANGGITLGNGLGTVMKTGTANRYLCVITGQAQQISGTIVYVSAP